MDASTRLFLGNGDATDIPSLKNKQNIYIFGNYDKEGHFIHATKVVIRNKPVTDRSNLSNVTPSIPTRYPDNTKKTLSMLGLTQ